MSDSPCLCFLDGSILPSSKEKLHESAVMPTTSEAPILNMPNTYTASLHGAIAQHWTWIADGPVAAQTARRTRPEPFCEPCGYRLVPESRERA